MADTVTLGGPILSLTVNPDGVLFAACNGGLFRKNDESGLWDRVLPGPGEEPIPVLCARALPNRRLLAALPGAIGISDTLGDRWTFVRLPEPEPLVTAFEFNHNGSAILAGTADDGLFRTTDLGESWHPCNFGLLDSSINALAFTERGSFLAGTGTGLFVSTNNGDSWERPESSGTHGAVYAVATRDNMIFASSATFPLVLMFGLRGLVMHVRDAFDAGLDIQDIRILDENFVAVLGSESVWISTDFGYSLQAYPSAENIGITAISPAVISDGELGIYTGDRDGRVLFIPISPPFEANAD